MSKTNLTRYEITICFYADQELTEQELDALELQISAQVEEPGEDSSYKVNLWHYDIKSAATYYPRRAMTTHAPELVKEA